MRVTSFIKSPELGAGSSGAAAGCAFCSCASIPPTGVRCPVNSIRATAQPRRSLPVETPATRLYPVAERRPFFYHHPMPNHILLIDCPDETGLVYRVTGVLYRHGCNVVSNNEFVDHDAGQFFMRTEFAGDLDPETIASELREALPKSAVIRLADDVPRRIVVMATKEPHCLGDLLIRHEFGDLNSQILAVISNHETLGGLVRRFGVPFHCFPHEGLTRERHEAAVL